MNLEPFWRGCPALLYGLTVLLACSAAYHFTPVLLIPLLLLGGSIIFQAKRFLFNALLFAIVYYFASLCYQAPPLQPNGVFGEARVRVEQVAWNQSKFKSSWIYKGTLLSFHTKDTDYTFPRSACTIKLQSDNRPSADQIYLVTGTLKETSRGRYSLTPKKGVPWTALARTRNFAEWRYHAKLLLKNYLLEKIENEQSAQFLAGIATGQFNDPYFSFEFSRFGLQHIMAISGFHFAIIAFILSLLFRAVFSVRATSSLVMIFLSLYFFLLGFSPSVLRAWLMILIGLSSQLLERPTNSLNAFGFALMAALLIDPWMIANLAFQLSFAITAGILLLYSPINTFCKSFFNSHTPSRLSILDQHGYLVFCFFRQGLALTLTVHLIGIPLVLLYFQKFPLFSMVYNLFFPFLVSFSMLFLILGFLTAPIPWLSALIHQVNNHFTEYLINLTYYMPLSTDVFIRTKSLSPDLVILYLTAIFFFGIWLSNRQKQNNNFIFV